MSFQSEPEDQTQENRWYGFTLEASALKPQEGPMFRIKCKDRKRPMSRLKSHQVGQILSYLWENQAFCSIQTFN